MNTSMSVNKIRRKFIDYYKARGHKEIPSAPLVPENDPTTLFTNCGMQPLVPYLLGETHPLGNKLVDSQLSFRAEDIEEVGDNRHTTFFEMLGNWSLGDYFKKEQLVWFAEFLIEVLKLPLEKLYVSVFKGNEYAPKDLESIEIWQKIYEKYGITAKVGERIFEYESEKNWWSRSGPPENMPIGEPGGPTSEVFYDFETPHNVSFGEACHVNCDCGRYMEIGNSVFMTYKKVANGIKPLPKQNVDFGGGLERLAAAGNNNPDIFKIDVFSSIIRTIELMAHLKYGQDEHRTRSMRIMADHIRGATFLIAGGVEPANKLQGYMVRRLIRRALLHSHKLGLGLTGESLAGLSQKVIDHYQDTYPQLFKDKEKIFSLLKNEGFKFNKTLNRGLKEIDKIRELDGKTAFYLYESYGFPLELTLEIAKERGQNINTMVFKEEFEKHKDESRTASAGMFKGGLADTKEETVKLHTASHLLQQALREVLGARARQKGSNITFERLRFDFTHDKPLTAREIKKVENVVNEKINEDLPVSQKTISFKEAASEGALFLPEEKYPDQVKVYSIGSYSKEICAGPHVSSTGELGKLKIVKEEGSGTGVRRIYGKLT